MVLAFAEAQCDGQRGFALDPSHDVRDPFGCERRIFAGLHHYRSISESFSLARAIQDFFARHAIALESAVPATQAAVHALPYAVARDLDQTAKMHRIADVLLAKAIGPRVELVQLFGPGLAQPVENLGLCQLAHQFTSAGVSCSRLAIALANNCFCC